MAERSELSRRHACHLLERSREMALGRISGCVSDLSESHALIFDQLLDALNSEQFQIALYRAPLDLGK